MLARPLRTCLAALAALFAATSADAQQRSRLDPDTVAVDRDLAYIDGGHERQKLDLYRPPGADGPLPVIVWIHGGGWQNGSKANCLPLKLGYVDKGYAVASVGYRLTDAATWPAQVDDCRDAIRWLRIHADKYGLDADRIGVWGASAGGHLAALVATMDDTKGDASGGDADGKDASARVQAACDYYGPTDLIAFGRTPGPGYGDRVSQPNSPEHKLLGGPIEQDQDRAREASAVTYASADDPPMLIVHGTDDPLVPLDQSERLYDALSKAGVPVHLHVVQGGGHGRPGFGKPAVLDTVAAFFARHLKQNAAGQNASEAMPTRRTESGL